MLRQVLVAWQNETRIAIEKPSIKKLMHSRANIFFVMMITVRYVFAIVVAVASVQLAVG